MSKANRKQAAEPGKNHWLSLNATDRKFLIGSLILHVVILILLLASWQSREKVKTVQLPANIQARVLSAAELKALRDKREQAQRKVANKKKKEAKIKAKAKRKKAEAKRKKEVKRKQEEARKKALILKEKRKKEKARKAKQEKQEKAKKKKALEAQRQKQQTQIKEALRKQEQEKKQSERELQLLEKMREIELREAQLQEQLKADRKAQQLERNQQLALERELNETERFMSLIRSRIESRWHIPPNSRKQTVVLRINLLPTGELAKVSVLEASGLSAMDQSALSAVRSVRLFPVPDNKAVFEKYFRQFSMSFSPE